MEIRKFIFTIASRFDPRGFKSAEDAAKRLRGLAGGVKQSVDGVTKAHDRSGVAAQKAADKSARAAKKTEQDFLKAVASAEKALDRQNRAVARAAAARERAAQRAATADARQAARASAAAKREADKAATARKRAVERSIAAEKRAMEKAAAAARRVRQLELTNDMKYYRRRQAMAERAAAAEVAAKQGRRADARQAMSDLGSVGSTVLRGVGVGVGGLAALSTGVINAGVSFESLRARLKTVEGSAEGAGQAFAVIQDFTKTTPFQLDEVTNAYVRLKNIGLDASKESLTAFGNIAAAQGKSIIDFIEAVADASTGEFERLKEFGIKASKQGEQVTFTFKGQQTTVANSAEAIQGFLKGIGETDFAGAMTDQMATASGVISNLQDSVQTFFDQVAQLGPLNEFKGLLNDIMNVGGGEGGVAQMVADILVTALQSLRETIQSITAEDIRGFLVSAQEAVSGLATVVGILIDALRGFVDMVGDTETAITALTLGVFALSAAFNGPAGLAVAAGAAGVAIGAMVANAIADMSGLNAEIDALDARILMLRNNIRKREANIDAIEGRIAAREQATEKKRQEIEATQREDVKQTVGGLGAGLLKEGDVADQAFRIRQIRDGQERDQGFENLFTAEGRQVYEAVSNAERKRVDAAEKRARQEARKAGRDEESAARAARSATIESNRAAREKAFQAATATFAQTGSAEAAADAAISKIGQVKGAAKPKKGKAGDTFFDFEKQASTAAKKQGEEFAQQELQRLVGEGITGKEALRMAQEAGKKRAQELEARFIEAGRIFDASADNILDILGLRGPGSVLEGRPPPQTLLITIAPVFKFIETFNQTIESVAGAQALSEVTGRGGEAAAEQGLTEGFDRFMGMFRAALALETERLLKADGGGRLPPGPQG